MQTDRFVDGALRPLIRFTENMYLQNLAMKKLLEEIPNLNWRKEVSLFVADRTGKNEFEHIYRSLGDPANLYEAIQELLSIKRAL